MDEEQLRAWAHTTPLEARFWSKVNIVDDDSSCWEWTRSRNPDGYGQFQWQLPGEEKRRVHAASRVAFILSTGVVPPVVRHACDTPSCCRPSHLIEGTQIDNVRDRVVRGRNGVHAPQRGETNKNAVLTDALVVQARARARAGEGHQEIAIALGIQRPTLSLAITGKTWSHLDSRSAPVPRRAGGTRLTEGDVRDIRSARTSGSSNKTLAKRYGLTPSAVSHIVHGRSWGHVTP